MDRAIAEHHVHAARMPAAGRLVTAAGKHIRTRARINLVLGAEHVVDARVRRVDRHVLGAAAVVVEHVTAGIEIRILHGQHDLGHEHGVRQSVADFFQLILLVQGERSTGILPGAGHGRIVVRTVAEVDHVIAAGARVGIAIPHAPAVAGAEIQRQLDGTQGQIGGQPKVDAVLKLIEQRRFLDVGPQVRGPTPPRALMRAEGQPLVRRLVHLDRQAPLLQVIDALAARAASRAACTAGKSSATRMPMIAMTTSNSTNVKAGRCRRRIVKSWQKSHGGPQMGASMIITIIPAILPIVPCARFPLRRWGIESLRGHE